MEKSIEFLSDLSINNSNYIIVGCSGGPDSMCLLNLLKSANYKVVCAHVNHNIRKESKDEYQFVKNYCEKNNIIFEGIELAKNDQNESYYRKKRQNFYKDLAKKYDTNYIMTAHHGDDLIETILMRISRGSNLKGYAGFPNFYKENNLIYIKPLIFYTKKDIIEYNEQNNIPYVLDSSNEKDTYTRNRYRHNVLPFLKTENESIHLKYLQFSKELYEAEEFINSQVVKAIEENYTNNKIDLNQFQKLNTFIQKKELTQILRDIYKNDVDKLRVFHIEKILELISKNKNFTLSLPLNIKIIREYNYLTITNSVKKEAFFIQFDKKYILPNGDTIEQISNTEDTSNYTIRLNSENIKLPLFIRSRKQGDKIQIKNMLGSKSIKSIFIDQHIPASLREEFPIVVDSNDTILWVPTLRKSKFDVNKHEKYDIILRYTKKGDKLNEKN